MAIIMRETQKVCPAQWEARWNASEARIRSSTSKRRYHVLSGVEDTNTVVVEFEFESLAALDAAYKIGEADLEYQELVGELDSIIASGRVELYTVLD